MDHGTIFLDVLTVSGRLRHLDAAKVESLAASMETLGLQQSISVLASEDGAVVELVAGAHRVAAAKKLGWEKIDCIFVNMDELDRRLWEIDENLMRAELTDLERAQHTAKRAEIVKQKVEFAKLAKTESNPSKNADKGQTEFVTDTAKKTGKSKRSVERDKARGEKIAPDVQKAIEGTAIENSGVQLDALAKATHDEQREAVKAVNLGDAKDVREVLPEAKGKKGKSRRTKEEIRLDNFDYAFQAILRHCSIWRTINVPNLDSKRRSRALADLRTAGKHIEELIQTIQHAEEVEANEPTRQNKSRPRD